MPLTPPALMPAQPEQAKSWREIIQMYRESVFAVVMENKLLGKKYSGSGFVIEPKYGEVAGQADHSFIITSLHIVQGASEGYILNSDQVTYRVDGLVHADIKNDIAVLQVPRLNARGVELGDPKKSLQVGDDVAVFGYPTYPEFYDGSLSTGIVAAYSRKRDEITRVVVNEFLQLTTPPSRGSSGSPVFNKQGKVVGMVNALYNPNSDSGGDHGFATFAIAALANKVNDLVVWLQEKGKNAESGTNFAVVPLNYIRKGVTIEDLLALQTEEFIKFRNADTGGQRGLKKENAEALLKKAEQSPLAQYLLAKALSDVKLTEESIKAYE
ncbi:MAG TPA: serine protease, partial [Prosthecobacter sp.]